jgi:hypothetical protein
MWELLEQQPSADVTIEDTGQQFDSGSGGVDDQAGDSGGDSDD